MIIQVVLALTASVFTASASVVLRAASAPAPSELRLSWRLAAFLLRRPTWFLGVLCMIIGLLFQLTALHYGELALVQPVIASELLFVFGFLAIRHRGWVRPRDWAAAAGMALSLAGFLYVADPSRGSVEGVGFWPWFFAGVTVAAGAGAAILFALCPGRRGQPASAARKAALLGVSAGVVWGFVAAVVKEMSSYLGTGPGAVLGNWSPYVLLVAGAVAMFIASNAFQAGPLAAAQPGLTIVDPMVASLLGFALFGEHVRHGAPELVAEALLLVVLVTSVLLLSRSHIVAVDDSKVRGAGVAPEAAAQRRARGRLPGGGTCGPCPSRARRAALLNGVATHGHRPGGRVGGGQS